MRFDVRTPVFAVAVAFAATLGPAPAAAQATSANPVDARMRTDLHKILGKKQFRDVQTSVQDGMVTLAGSVTLFSDKLDAEKRAHRVPNVTGIEDKIEVAGPQVEDATLLGKLSRKVFFDVGYGGSPVFNAIAVNVQNGIVTLGGVAATPSDKADALAIVEGYPGVKGVVDNLAVCPLSPMDNQSRVAEYRAIYGSSTLSKYAMDPAKPIRITVVNGRVTLSGVVDSQADKDAAGIRANGVPGVFAVTNNLQVAGSSRTAS